MSKHSIFRQRKLPKPQWPTAVTPLHTPVASHLEAVTPQRPRIIVLEGSGLKLVVHIPRGDDVALAVGKGGRCGESYF